MQLTSAIAGANSILRLTSAMEQIAPDWPASGAQVLIALSGGADSLALVTLAQKAWPGRVSALTLDHQLRAQSADEAQFCAQICQELNVPHSIAYPPSPITGNLQAEARRVRYTLLAEKAAALGHGTLIATAHHADDQIETLLMRIARGSGVAGLSGIRMRRGNIVRLLLGFRKSELEDVCRAAELKWVEDPSNSNARFDRVRMRKALAKAQLPIGADALTRTVKAMQDADEALDYAASQLAKTHISAAENGLLISIAGLPHELKRRLLMRAAEILGDHELRGDKLERAMNTALKNRQCSLGQLILKGADETWILRPAPPRQTA